MAIEIEESNSEEKKAPAVVDNTELILSMKKELDALKANQNSNPAGQENVAEVLKSLVSQLKEKPDDETKQQEIHLIAKLCGLPLHQFGEGDVELWPQAASKIGATVNPTRKLNAKEKQQKARLEKMIIEALTSILKSKDSFVTCSEYTLSVQNLLMDLVNAGIRVFPDFSTALFEEHSHQSPLLQALVCHKSDQRLLSAQNSSCFFNIPPENETTSSQLRLESK